MAKPTPVVLKGKPPSARRMLREMERNASEFETAKTVRRLFKGLRKDRLEQLGWIAATKRGRRLIGRALKRVHREHMEELKSWVEKAVAKPACKRKTKV
jgi:hypothetical protein